MVRHPWGYGQCLFGIELPDSLGLPIARDPARVPDVGSGPEWVPRALTGRGDTVVVVRVVGALCRDSTAAYPLFALPHAVVESQGRFALASLAPASTEVQAQAGRLRVAKIPRIVRYELR